MMNSPIAVDEELLSDLSIEVVGEED